MEHGGHVLLFLLPLALVALFRARHLVPTALLLLTLSHSHVEPLSGVTAEPAPICCVLAQSIEAEPAEFAVETAAVARLPGRTAAFPPIAAVVRPPAIRAPPVRGRVPTPATWPPVSRAA